MSALSEMNKRANRMGGELDQAGREPEHSPIPDRPHLIRDLAVIVALVAVVTVPSLFTRDLWNPDEPRYMEVAREMVLLDDYVLPHLNGQVYSEKPPVFFWLAGMLYRAGLGYNSGRLVTIAAVLGTLLMVYWPVRKSVGSQAALLTAGAALGTVILLGFSKIGVLDPLLMFFTTSALVLGYNALSTEARHARSCWLGCYACMGLGTLTKGPVGMLVPALILVVYGTLNRKNVRAGGKTHIAGITVFAGIILAWLVPAIIKGGREYAQIILFKQNLGRAVSSYSHRQPFYYYVLQAPLYFLPWSFVLPSAVLAAVREWRRNGTSLPLFASAWLCTSLVFFSLISGKRMNYIVPAAPAAAILTAWYVTSASDRQGRWQRVDTCLRRAPCVVVVLAVSSLTVAVMLWPWLSTYIPLSDSEMKDLAMWMTPVRLIGIMVALAGILAVSIAALWVRAEKGALRTAILVTSILLISLLADVAVLPVVNQFKSGRGFGDAVRERAHDSDRVFMFKNNFSGVYNLYTGFVKMPVIENAEQLRARLSDPDVFVIGNVKDIRKALTPLEMDRYVVHRETVGHRVMVLLEGYGQEQLTAVPRKPAREALLSPDHG